MEKVNVVSYDPQWPLTFEKEAAKIKSKLGNNCLHIHHVGSTSVPGLAAKPKIDIIAEVKDLVFNHEGLEELDYEYRGGFNLPLRKSFTYRSTDLDVNLHVFEQGDPEVELNLRFRDYLKAHPETRDEYARLKYNLIQEESSHKKEGKMYKGYTLGKNDLIQKILKKSGYNRLRFVLCTHYAEWAAAKNFRNTYFFTPNKMEDPYTWTFNHEDHKHFILYKGIERVGYAHIQLWPEKRAAVRIIVIDKKLRGQNFGSTFMTLIEKWLKFKGFKSIHVESSSAALTFYKKLSYKEMPFNDPDLYEGSPEDTAVGKVL